ncbi:SRPBCC family protein [Ferrovibrio sp.]|uniref:SRPBCC family protein n=1 Tax=Ferrovibrio sp. TaxID=1917215 RepID=UPI0035AF53FD
MTRIATSNEYAELRDGSTLVIQRWFPGSAARLWRYLVDAELRRKWFADGIMQSAAGTALELVWRNDDLSGPDDPRPEGVGGEQRMPSKVIAFDEPHRLAILWGQGQVIFDLVEKGSRVLLTITHTGLDASKIGIFAGWHSHLDILSSEIEGSHRPSFWLSWTRLRDEYLARLAARQTKSA